MKLKEHLGNWNLRNGTPLDDILYNLYVIEHNEYFGDRVDNSIYMTQSDFKYEYNKEISIYHKYKQTSEMILRKEKIEKLKNKINLWKVKS